MNENSCRKKKTRQVRIEKDITNEKRTNISIKKKKRWKRGSKTCVNISMESVSEQSKQIQLIMIWEDKSRKRKVKKKIINRKALKVKKPKKTHKQK